MATGPIPITAYYRFAEFHELTRDETKFLITCIREIDSWYLEAANKSRAKSK